MAGDRGSAVRVNHSTPRAHYTIGSLDASLPPPVDCRGTSVGDALGHCEDLLSERGEARGSHFAARILAIYGSFDEAARAAFFDGLVERFSVDPSTLQH